MSSDPRKPERSLTEAAAERAQERSGEASPWATALRELASVDQAAYEAVARTPTPSLMEPHPKALERRQLLAVVARHRRGHRPARR